MDRFPLTVRPILAEAGRWRGGFPRRSFGPSRSRGVVILPPGNAEAESAGARRGPFRRSPSPGRDGAGSRPGDLVLDSFARSGTTLMGSVSLVSRAIGVKSRFLWVFLPRPKAGPCPGNAGKPSPPWPSASPPWPDSPGSPRRGRPQPPWSALGPQPQTNLHFPGRPLVPRKDLGQESPLPVPGYPKLRRLARRRDEVPGVVAVPLPAAALGALVNPHPGARSSLLPVPAR